MHLKVVEDHLGKGLRAERSFAADEPVISLQGQWVNAPSKYTIQLGETRHLKPKNHLWALINHSCAPNLRVDHVQKNMVALRSIAAGEALSFNYLTTEWDMASPFECQCRLSNCFGTIAGARYLAEERRSSQLVWKHQLADAENEIVLDYKVA